MEEEQRIQYLAKKQMEVLKQEVMSCVVINTDELRELLDLILNKKK